MKNNFECRRILVADTANSREKLLIRKKKLYNYDLHWHDCFEIELVLSGNVTQVLNGESYDMNAGTLYMLNPTDFHSIKSSGADVYNIMFSDEVLDEEVLQKILSVEKNIVFALSEREMMNIKFMMSQMLYEFENNSDFSDLLIKNYMECLLMMILRKCDFKAEVKREAENDSIRKSLLYIHSRFRENPSLNQVAEIAGFNKNYFSGLFHQTTGKTYKEYLNALKLEHAKKLVLTSNIPITEICYAAGYNSLTNFLRVFKSQYGVSPAVMRKEHKKISQN